MSDIHSETARSIAFVRTKEAPKLPAPPSSTGWIGWTRTNITNSMTDFSSPLAALGSLVMIVLTVGVVLFFYNIAKNLIDFAFLSAVWNDPDEQKRLACATIQQGGELPADWFGACWPYAEAKWKLWIYGKYPASELWRIDAVLIIGAVGIAYLIMDALPSRALIGGIMLALAFVLGSYFSMRYGEAPYERSGVVILALVGLLFTSFARPVGRGYVAVFMLAVFPVIAFVLLTGGNLDTGAGPGILGSLIPQDSVPHWLRDEYGPLGSGFWDFTLIGAVVLLLLGWLGRAGILGNLGSALSGLVLNIGLVLVVVALVVFAGTIDVGLPVVETNDWGGLAVTLVVAITGIVVSLPLGIVLALGRRSQLPAVRWLCVAFIEFWRGVPLITVLFMSSVMLPLFLPEGTEFNKLLRALIGVALFSSAYMAEVIRGGLQAIPKGQYEGAMANGLSYWQMMRLVVLPQALTLVIPGIVNTFIGLFKDTTLVLIIGLFDLLGQIQQTFTDSAWSTPVTSQTGYLVCATIFFLFCFGMSRYSQWMERQLYRGHKR